MSKLFGGVVFILVGALVAFFFESYRDATSRKLRDWGRRDTALTVGIPFSPFFVLVIRGFGVIFMLIGLALCLGEFM